MNKREVASNVHHILTVHLAMYPKTTLISFRAGKRSLVRLARKEIKEAQAKIKAARNDIYRYTREARAYDKILK